MKAVIFDLDGVLIDSEPLQRRASQRLFAKYGRRFTRQHEKEFLGLRVVDEITILKQRWQIEASIEKLLAERKQILSGLVKLELKLTKRAGRLLEDLRGAGLPMGLGTSGETWYVKLVMDKFGIGKYFGAVVTGDDVVRGKPDPEVYLQVAERLGVDPRSCLVVEDAVSGVAAAKAAGMICWAVPDLMAEKENFYKADKICKSLVDVRRCLL